MKKSRRWIVTGEIGSGKSTFCQQAADLGKRSGLKLGGLLSPAVFEGGTKIAIQAVNLKNNQARQLATLRRAQDAGLATKRWTFIPETVKWGNEVLSRAVPCDLLIIDELGPLEFERGEGWVEGLLAVDGGNYTGALVVIRPSLIKQARQRWPDAEVVEINPGDDPGKRAEQIFSSLFEPPGKQTDAGP